MCVILTHGCASVFVSLSDHRDEYKRICVRGIYLLVTLFLIFLPFSPLSPLPPLSHFCSLFCRVIVIVFFPDALKGITENEEFKKGIASQKDMQQSDPTAVWKKMMGLESKGDDDDE